MEQHILITGEIVYGENSLVSEYNKLTYTMNREMWKLTEAQVLEYRARIVTIFDSFILNKQEQLALFDY